jgi:hypothetical protein
MEELKVGLNHMSQKSGLHLEVHCDCEAICGATDESPSTCVGSHATYLGIIGLWEAIVCPKDPHYEWHARNCVFGTCKGYNVDNLALCLDEEEGTLGVVVSWKCFSMKKVVIKKGEEKKKLKLMHMEANSKEFILALKSKLQYFVAHNFITRWQD